MIRRPPRSTLDRSSAASDVYKRQGILSVRLFAPIDSKSSDNNVPGGKAHAYGSVNLTSVESPVSYTHLRAHETVLDLVCRLLLEKKKNIRK